jgi:hypothetical protein
MTVAQPTSPTRSPQPYDPCYGWPPRRQPFVLSGLRTLFLSCRSFSHSNRLFSIACALFDKMRFLHPGCPCGNTGGGIPSFFSLYSASVPSVSLWQTASVFRFEPSTVDYEPSPARKAQKCLSASPLLATLTHSSSRKSFPCHSYANTRDGGASAARNFFVIRSVSLCLGGKTSSLSTFRINTCKTVSKQTTSSPFRINTYEKPGGGGALCFAPRGLDIG